jgi:hypothetical protein
MDALVRLGVERGKMKAWVFTSRRRRMVRRRRWR